MAMLSKMLRGTTPPDMSIAGQASRLGDANVSPELVFNPTQRVDNQMKTANQVMNYAASKQMAEQGHTDMRGNVAGYSDTLG